MSWDEQQEDVLFIQARMQGDEAPEEFRGRFMFEVKKKIGNNYEIIKRTKSVTGFLVSIEDKPKKYGKDDTDLSDAIRFTFRSKVGKFIWHQGLTSHLKLLLHSLMSLDKISEVTIDAYMSKEDVIKKRKAEPSFSLKVAGQPVPWAFRVSEKQEMKEGMLDMIPPSWVKKMTATQQMVNGKMEWVPEPLIQKGKQVWDKEANDRFYLDLVPMLKSRIVLPNKFPDVVTEAPKQEPVDTRNPDEIRAAMTPKTDKTATEALLNMDKGSVNTGDANWPPVDEYELPF